MLKKIHHHLHRHYHTKYHGKYTHAKQLFIFDIFLLVLAIAIFASGVVFLLRKPVVKDDVEMVVIPLLQKQEGIGGGQTIKSGAPIKLSIEYTNTGNTTLHPSTLALRLPRGFVIDRTQTPESVLNKDATAKLTSTIAPGARGHLEVYGRWWGEAGKPERIFVTLSYFEDQNKALNQKLISFEPRIESSVIESELVVATTSFPNQPLPFSFTAQNTSDQPISSLSLTPSWEGAYTVTSSLQNLTLAPRETKTVTGVLTASSEADVYRFAMHSSVAIQDRMFKQTSDEELIAVVYPAIVSSARLAQPNLYVEEKQTIPVEIAWRNDSDFAMSNQRLRIRFVPHNVIDVAATALTNNIGRDGNDLIISSAHKTALAHGEPGAGDRFTLQILTLPTFTLAGEKINLEIIPSMEAETVLVREQRFARDGEKLLIPIAGNVELTRSEVRYYTPEGDQIGRGALPPKVGETTKYWVLLQAANATNELKDAELKIRLAPGVRFSTTSQSVTLGPQLQHDPATNSVIWKHSTVPANSKTGWNFIVEVIPTAEQVGKTLPLISSGIFQATDGVVGKKFEIKIGEMNNVLKANDRGSRTGARVKK